MTDRKVLFCIIIGLFWFSLYAYVPQMTIYAMEMGASYKMIGMIAGAYGLSQTILRIPLGIVSDILNKRKVFITLGLTSAVISSLLVFIFPNTYTLLAARVLAGVAAATWVNFTIMYSSFYEQYQSTKAMGIATSANRVGQFAAMLAGGFAAVRLGNRYLFLLSAVGGITGFIFSLFLHEELNIEDRKPLKASDLLVMIKNRDLMHISVLGIMSQLIIYSTTFGFTPLVGSKLGADNFQLGMLSIAFILPQILFAALSGTLLEKYLGVGKTLLTGMIINTVSCIITPFAYSMPMLYIIQFINGIGNALTFPLLMGLVIKYTDLRLRNSAMGFYQAAYGLGMIMGPVLLGIIGDRFGLLTGFLVTGLFGLLASITILMRRVDNTFLNNHNRCN